MKNIESFIGETGYPKDVVLDFLQKKGGDISLLYCKCGKPKRIIKSKQAKLGLRFDGYCGSKECHQFFGKKRPDHSKRMKELAATGESASFSKTLIKKGELFNPKVNTVDFKRKKLSNKGYNVDDLSDDDIISLEKEYESNKQFTNEFLAKKISKFVSKHNLRDSFYVSSYDDLVVLPNEELRRINRRVYSYHHMIYCSDVCVAKHFNRIEKFSLQHNIRGISYIKTRSSYESNYIDFFEKNSIPWDYEPFRIMIENEYYVSYTPDFIFDYEGKRYMVEVKGYLLEEHKHQYLKYKINPAYEYVKDNPEYGGFIFTYDAEPKTMKKILTNLLEEKF